MAEYLVSSRGIGRRAISFGASVFRCEETPAFCGKIFIDWWSIRNGLTEVQLKSTPRIKSTGFYTKNSPDIMVNNLVGVKDIKKSVK
jgi:hypothetical protein